MLTGRGFRGRAEARSVRDAPVPAGGPVVAELLRQLRRVPNRMLHRSRRRAALALLAARPRPANILVLCNGNIFRSPFAAAVLRRTVGSSGIRVESAGFIGPGRPSPPGSRVKLLAVWCVSAESMPLRTRTRRSALPVPFVSFR